MASETWRPGTPTAAGWYAVVVCWDTQEGLFPNAAQWDGAAWIGEHSARPIVQWAGPFLDASTADDWAQAHDPEGA